MSPRGPPPSLRRSEASRTIAPLLPSRQGANFPQPIAQLPDRFRRTMYLLVSQDDGALRVSRLIAGGVPRVGAADAPELEKLGVTVIDLSEIDDSSAGSHAKFAGSHEVVQLIGAGLETAGRFGDVDFARPRRPPRRGSDPPHRPLSRAVAARRVNAPATAAAATGAAASAGARPAAVARH